jgi:hypothetical protein
MIVGLAVIFLSGSAHAQILDDFEHGNKALYTQIILSPDNLVFDGLAAHDGLLGAAFNSDGSNFYFRTDVSTQPGRTFTSFVRSKVNSGRTYIGVGASANGAWSMVAGFNTSSIHLQDNTGFNYLDLAHAPFQFQPGVWYQLELDWAVNGDMTVRLWDEAHVSLLAETPTVSAVTTQPGGVSMRSFMSLGDENHVDTIRANDSYVVTYCTAKVNSLGCLPAISATGVPRASASSAFVVVGSPVYNQKPGLLFYSTTGRQAVPFQGGILCAAPPIRRTPALSSGGDHPANKNCTGGWRIDMNAFAAGAIGGKPDPLLRVPGTFVHCQWWGRDPGFAPPNATALTDGLQYAVGP